MDVTVKPGSDGCYELVELRPTVIATFSDPRMADEVAAFLNQREDRDQHAQDRRLQRKKHVEEHRSKRAAPPEPDANDQADGAHEDVDTADIGTAVETASQPEPRTTSTDPTTWTDEELAEAFTRIAAGEKLGAVADDFGKPMPKLRSRWARHQKAEKAQTKPVKTTEAQEGSDDDLLEECRLCGKVFKVSGDLIDTCAACTRGLA